MGELHKGQAVGYWTDTGMSLFIGRLEAQPTNTFDESLRMFGVGKFEIQKKLMGQEQMVGYSQDIMKSKLIGLDELAMLIGCDPVGFWEPLGSLFTIGCLIDERSNSNGKKTLRVLCVGREDIKRASLGNPIDGLRRDMQESELILLSDLRKILSICETKLALKSK